MVERHARRGSAHERVRIPAVVHRGMVGNARPPAAQPGREHGAAARRHVQGVAGRGIVPLSGAAAGRARRGVGRPRHRRAPARRSPRAAAGGRAMKLATLANAAVVHTRRWVEHFRARGHDVRVFSLEPPWTTGDPGIVRLPAAPLPGALRYPLAVPRLQRELKRFKPDVVDAHFVPNYGLMGALSGFRPLSIAAWGSDLLMSTGAPGLWRNARAGYVLRRAALVLCDAENLAAAARRAGAVPERVRAIAWGDRAHALGD